MDLTELANLGEFVGGVEPWGLAYGRMSSSPREGESRMTDRTQIDPGWTWDDDFIMSQAIKMGNAIFVSGQVALDPAGGVVGKGDMKAQTRQVFKNLQTVLGTAGSSLGDIVKITVFTTDISRLMETHEVRAEVLPNPPPASTAVEVKALAFPDLLIEIEAVAVTGQ